MAFRKGGAARSALAQADTLVRDGRRLDAIEVLTAANAARRDAEIERRLIHMRNAAWADVESAAGLSVWPPPAPDLFSGADGLPEITPSELSAETIRSGIVRHGALVVRGLVPPKLVDHLTGVIDNAFTAYDDHFAGSSKNGAPSPWFEPFETESVSLDMVRKWVRDGGGVLTVESPRAAFEVLDAFEEIGLAESLAGYLGERPTLAAEKWTLRRVPIDSGSSWHQDGAFLGDGIRACNVWISLTHCGDDAPSLDVVARRIDHIVPTGTEGAPFNWSVGDPVVERVAEGAPIVRPIFEPGDAVLFDDLFLHQTGTGPGMKRERYALESWFFAPSHYPPGSTPVVF